MSSSLIAALHAAPAQWVMALTGGGASVAGDLLRIPGGSRSILEILIPYQEQALADFLGHRPDQYCSAATSQIMARQALARARWLTRGGDVIGLGCTASLVSDRPKRGAHRVFVSTAGFARVRTWSLTLLKGARDRGGEEAVAAALVLQAMAQTVGLAADAPVPLLDGERIEEENVAAPRPAGPMNEPVLVESDGRWCRQPSWDAAKPWALVPGAFNPLHGAHLAMASAAERLEGKPVAFELSVANVDKAELSQEEVCRRLAQFIGKAPVWVTHAPRFIDKAALFPGAIFVVGADTALRIVSPRYYGGQAERMAEAFAVFRRQGCRFLVAGRVAADGRYLGLDDVPIPPEAHALFRAIPPEEFRMDVSSTELRQRRP